MAHIIARDFKTIFLSEELLKRCIPLFNTYKQMKPNAFGIYEIWTNFIYDELVIIRAICAREQFTITSLSFFNSVDGIVSYVNGLSPNIENNAVYQRETYYDEPYKNKIYNNDYVDFLRSRMSKCCS